MPINITPDEILAIDKRIKSCLVENRDEENDEYYVKIRFSYQINGKEPKTDGREEFVNESKDKLILQIKDFMMSDKNGWSICDSTEIK